MDVLRSTLYAAILTLVVLGARSVGYDITAELYFRASQNNLSQSQISRAYANALKAVQLRPGALRYWQMLAATKLAQRQFESLLEDQAAFQTLSAGDPGEEDLIRFAFAHFFLAHYDKVITLTQNLIWKNRVFALPYVLRGAAYTALKKYAEAERSFLEVLQMFPGRQDAVEGLAHVYFLNGEAARAMAVLNKTADHPFPPEARKRFEDLKALYAE